MTQDITPQSPFDRLRKVDEFGNEYWSARDLYPHSGYSEFRKFEMVIRRAMQACRNNGENVELNFAETSEVSSAERGPSSIKDYRISRYGAYLTFMNGDPNNHQIALAQSYFAIKTREAEVTAELTPAEYLLQQAQRFVDIEKRATELAVKAGYHENWLTRLNSQVYSIENRVEGIEQRTGWSTTLAYTKKHKLDTSDWFGRKLGTKAGKIARLNGIEPHPVASERYGTVNSYPDWVLDQAVEEIS